MRLKWFKYLFLFALLLAFGRCAKKKAFKAEDGQAAVEVRHAQAEEDLALIDINQALAGQWMLRGKAAAATATNVFGALCGFSIDTSSVGQGIIRLNYDGSECSGRRRSGSIILTVQNFSATTLKTAGCVVDINFQNYMTTQTSTGNSLNFNGTAHLTNQSGGTWYELVFLNQQSLTQALTATNLEVSIKNMVFVHYNISRSAAYTYSNGVVSCSESGFGTHNGLGNTETWGVTSVQKEFTSQISTPLKWSTVCGPVSPLGGEVSVKETEKDFALNVQYGVDASGNSFSQSGSNCPFGFKTSWSYSGDTRSLVFGYTD